MEEKLASANDQLEMLRHFNKSSNYFGESEAKKPSLKKPLT